ncbi:MULTISPECIES: trifunctional transcriptional regulator/proline dehydrogenase/L-glutamate gamma-semialdehyde dehydrogenase [Acinetobacter]|uniref:trifunctional transcriptional regulator/proline dehydrogenase/L-glutamate gamma-semialdehyde dehydrogenase n=1 Tax=Acinetobacter TaxID=469 RepID=UPI00073856FF|nr:MULTISPECIES: trifunctional transcriptional regulator/proline dehydrogenase/L-glutamate gamma-semialdehyde dehydrogenase [Acinetobacter]AXF45667.1 trifunctional transcriptional regulator/proline dehydrogenase/L-glutamate gamma-semialdehyde dehydrogenase [Acinetobacter johnsonii]KUG38661.1 transcriptional regulator [Acinetobacter johnsonii]MDH1276811.1 trifunctional transcriptional regulator/proline dehydrogenase/L-glutamate gamma-semialdehyde dehydrogenase [Acinetobacter johnsonii]MDH1712240
MNMMESNTHFNDAQTQFEYITEFKEKSELEVEINTAWRRAETDCVQNLLDHSKISDEMNQRIHELAFDLAHTLRERKSGSGKAGIVQGLLQEFALSSQEGIALMCLAEALLRIPDMATRDLLIKDKINQGNWKEHVGQSNLMFVNAAAWGLMLTGKLMETPKQNSLSGTLTGLLARSGRGIIRKAVDVAMRMMGEQFVTGETIGEALQHAERLEEKGFRYSYDMLGEAALTDHDADRYMKDYTDAIHAIGQASKDKDVYDGPGISIKLSALHPRYQRAQVARMHEELYGKVFTLAKLARGYNIGLNIDAEESERLEISLEMLERLCFEPELKDWKGIGFVIQAYQKRCFYVVDYIVDLAKRSEKRLMIRLVKGAYWDSEIKKAQIEGMTDYPVFTRKVHTDLSYISCAKKLLAAPEQIYPQFATHNAQTLATIYEMANPEKYYVGQYEFQCLHGMGEPLYEQVVGEKLDKKLGVPCRIYAPVGNHETLLAYLVRRLLENGANTSFVNRIADKSLAIDDLIENPTQTILSSAKRENIVGQKHLSIPLPAELYGQLRANSKGLDLANDSALAQLNQTAQQFAKHQWSAAPMGEHIQTNDAVAPQSIINPARHSDVVGYVQEATTEQVEQALNNAQAVQDIWARTAKDTRASYLLRAADLMEARLEELMVLLCRESGKTYANAIAEVREAVDFLRYYATQMIDLDANAEVEPLGTMLCISPWNFPLAIFTGQVAAALVAGNTVIAKPAEQTPLIAAQAIQILWQAGVPQAAVQLMPGRGETVGAQLSAAEQVQGIMFTGSTEVAKILQKTVAKRLSKTGESIPLIAETGGQNAMIVDSSALTEQVVLDVVSSAYDSAGQRCSALRVLCVQEDNADAVIQMLKGAMQQLQVGNPYLLKTDIGPVIDAEAQENIQKHIDKMRQKGHRVHQLMRNDAQDSELDAGTFITPTLIELPNLNDLEREVFGPVLHVIRFNQGSLKQLLEHINSKGYGLTMGLHTRIDETIQTVMTHAEVGNLYINRNIVGAVVGVQPFGGEGLSGTGPKAGGPIYLYRLMQNCSAKKLNKPFATGADLNPQVEFSNSALFLEWAAKTFPAVKLAKIENFCSGHHYELQGPTGESNQYMVIPRHAVLSLAEQEADQLQQLNAIFAVGSRPAVLADNSFVLKHIPSMPKALAQAFHVIKDIKTDAFDAVLHHGTTAQLLALQQQIAERQGAIVGITHLSPSQTAIPLERFVIERAISVNTAAAGGNASLMTLN